MEVNLLVTLLEMMECMIGRIWTSKLLSSRIGKERMLMIALSELEIIVSMKACKWIWL